MSFPMIKAIACAAGLVAACALAAPLPLAAQAADPQAQARPLAPQGPSATLTPEVRRLFAAMGLYDVLDIMSAEGIAAAPDLEADLFAGKGGSAWLAVVSSLYATERMIARFEAAIPAAGLTPDQVAELTLFFDSALGARVVAGEIAARRAFLDPMIEEAATDLAQRRAAEGHPRVAQLTRFITANDLIERNVSGALNSNFAFFRALSDNGAFEAPIPEDAMLAEVWGQEPSIRAETMDWLFAYQMLAYEDLTEAELDAYIALCESPAGQALNGVLFAAFDVLFEAVSADLGRLAAGFIAGEDT